MLSFDSVLFESQLSTISCHPTVLTVESYTISGYSCLHCETSNLAIQRAVGLAIFIVERRRQRGALSTNEAMELLDALQMIKNERYGCDHCNDNRIVTYPPMNQPSELLNTQVPRRLPDEAAQLLSECGLLPAAYSHRRANFRY